MNNRRPKQDPCGTPVFNLYNDDDTVGLHFLAVGWADLFRFCSLKTLTKPMSSCVKMLMKTLPVFSNLARSRNKLLPISLVNISGGTLKRFTKYSFDFY